MFRSLTTIFLCTLCVIIGAVGLGHVLPAPPQLSYVSQVDGKNWHIHLMDIRYRIDITLTRGLFPDYGRNRLPTWSPDGRKLAFVSDGDSGNHVYLYDMTTHALTRLTAHDHTYNSLSWSPDGTRLLTSATPTSPVGVLVIDVAAAEIIDLTPGTPDVQYAQFSPDGDNVYYIETKPIPRVMSLNPQTGDQRCIASCAMWVRQIQKPVWREDQLAYVYTQSEHDERLKIVDVHTGREHDLITGKPLTSAFAWAPGGDGLAVSIGTYNAGYTLYFVNDLTRAEAPLTPSLKNASGWLGELAWAPGSDWLALVMSSATMPQEIMLYDPRTGHARRLTYSENLDWAPTWRPNS